MAALHARQNAVTFLGGASHAFYQPENAPLPIAFEVRSNLILVLCTTVLDKGRVSAGKRKSATGPGPG